MSNIVNKRIIDPFFNDAINQVYKHPKKTAFFMDGTIGVGKALAHSELVLTPKGYVPMGKIRRGDSAIGSDGLPTAITGIYPQGEVEIAKVTFDDGSEVRCSYDHLWSVKTYCGKTWKTLTTQQIIDAGVSITKKAKKLDGTHQRQYQFSIPTGSENQFDSGDELPLHPYVMGALLGDGGFTHHSVSFTNGKAWIVEKVESLLPDTVQFTKHYENNAWHCRTRGVKKCHNIVNKIMRELGLWGKYSYEKHIPEIYKNSSAENRRLLMQGLLDTDGCLLKSGSHEYSTSSPQLIEDYRFIASSLGIDLGTTSTKIPTYTYKGEKRTGKKSYRVTTRRRVTPTKRIVDIQPDGTELATCITVDAEDSLFVTNGFNLTHNSSNFLMMGAYDVSCHVSPIKKGNKLIRESLWAGIRESENSAVATFLQLLEGSIFTPEVMALENSPVKTIGSHPTVIQIEHDLPDNTILRMKIECHGFNNEKAANRLRTREYMGALIPEAQGVPYHIIVTAIERCGRWRTDGLSIEKKIDGKTYRLSGVVGLAVVLCDINIPERPHALYKNYYDLPDKTGLPRMFITPPSPLLEIPVEKATQQILDKYPVTRFEGRDVVWVPNPKVYNMTRHYEEEDDAGNKIPWSGYRYWMNHLHNNDSHVRRYIKGVPDTVGGDAAVYNTFVKGPETLIEKPITAGKDVWVGFDPGGHAAIEMAQLLSMNTLHFFKEFCVEPSDRVSTRKLFSDFFLPYCRKRLQGHTVIIVPDPASVGLGKSIMTGNEESVLIMIKDEVEKEMKAHPGVKYVIQACKVRNQATDIRINSLGYFIDQGKCTIDPKEVPQLIGAVSGGYQRKKLSSGVISDTIDKDNPFSHPAEAAQYIAVNVVYEIKKGKKRASNDNRSQFRKFRRVKR